MSAIRNSSWLWVALTLAVASGCTDEWAEGQEPSEEDEFFTKAEWETIKSLSPEGLAPEYFAPPAEPSNAFSDSDAAAELGQLLFFDESLSRVDGVNLSERRSCATCHLPDRAFSDNGGLRMSKDVTSVLNIAFYDYHTMIGKHDSLWSMPMAPTTGFLNNDRLGIVRVIGACYREEYERVFATGESEQFFDRLQDFAFDAWLDFLADRGFDDPMDPEFLAHLTHEDVKAVHRVYANYGKALAAYMRKIVTGPTRFDAYAHSQRDEDDEYVLNAQERRGLKLFISKARCIDCHSGPRLTDNEFHDIGVPAAAGEDSRADGLGLLHEEGTVSHIFRLDGDFSDDRSELQADHPQPTEADEGAYRTPTLRNVERTPPYMHTGARTDEYDTLDQVVYHYNNPTEADDFEPDAKFWRDGLGLDPNEEQDLVAFLRTLNGGYCTWDEKDQKCVLSEEDEPDLVDSRWTQDLRAPGRELCRP